MTTKPHFSARASLKNCRRGRLLTYAHNLRAKLHVCAGTLFKKTCSAALSIFEQVAAVNEVVSSLKSRFRFHYQKIIFFKHEIILPKLSEKCIFNLNEDEKLECISYRVILISWLQIPRSECSEHRRVGWLDKLFKYFFKGQKKILSCLSLPMCPFIEVRKMPHKLYVGEVLLE
jgi:hypothetical protein